MSTTPPPPPPGSQPYGYGPAASDEPHHNVGTDDKVMMVLAHLSAPIAALLTAGWLSVVGPLLVWVLYKDRSPEVRRAAAGAFNFNITFWLLYLVSWLMIFTIVGALVGIPLLIVIFVVSLVLHVVGAIRASGGRGFTYPFQIPILR